MGWEKWGETEVSFGSGGELQARITHFSTEESRLEREHPRRLLSSPSLFHSFEISFRVKVFPLLFVGTLN